MAENKMLKIEEIKGVTICYLSGHLDASMVSNLNGEIGSILEGKSKKLVFDLGELSYISSAGLRIFLFSAKKMKLKNGEVGLCSPSQNVKRILDLASLANVLQIYDDKEAALKVLSL